MNKTNMLTKEQALEIVLKKLRQMSSPDDPFIIVEADTIEKPFGWVFFYNSKKFIETGIFRYRLAGNGPVMVNKTTRMVEFCGTNKPVQELIKDYEQKIK
jgi:hypothetical protein